VTAVGDKLLPVESAPVLDRLLAGFSVLAAGVLCIPALLTLAAILRTNEFYGHALLIPATSAYLAWASRDSIREALRALEAPPLGLWIVFGVGIFQACMLIGDVRFLSGLGIPLVLAATAYGVGGRRLLEPVALPLAFLAAAVPPPGFVNAELLIRLKLFVTQAAVSLLQGWDFTVSAEGNRILVPGHSLFVADACSGLTSIVVLFPFACVIAYFLSRGIWRRALIVASVVPLAVAANILRILLTVTMVSSWGIESAQGVLHSSFGVATYVVGNLALIGLARLLR
jgi:exosortase